MGTPRLVRSLYIPEKPPLIYYEGKVMFFSFCDWLRFGPQHQHCTDRSLTEKTAEFPSNLPLMVDLSKKEKQSKVVLL